MRASLGRIRLDELSIFPSLPISLEFAEESVFRALKHQGIVIFTISVITWGGWAFGQRQRFPAAIAVDTVADTTVAPRTFSPAPSGTMPPYSPPAYNSAPYGPGTGPQAPYRPAPYNSAPYNSPPYNSPTSPYNPAPYGSAPPMSPGPVPVTPGAIAGPTTNPLYGGVVLPPPQWDPYAPPGGMQQPVLLPQDPYIPGSPTDSIVRMRRLLDELRLDYTFLSPSGEKKFGSNDLGLSATFAFPLFFNQDSPILVTPGFTVHWWEGPTDYTALPPRVYDAYLTSAWNPQISPWLGGELEFTVGVYSDFKKVTEEALRYTGTGLVVLNFSEAMTIKAGIVYYDRVKIKLLPAGGLFWRPNPNTRFDFYFPEPRFATRMTTIGNTEWWFYVRGEYGGGSWVFTWTELGAPGDRPVGQADYNDIRIAMGLEFARLNVLDGHIEFGVAFNRQIVPRASLGIDEYKPSTTFFLGAGLAY